MENIDSLKRDDEVTVIIYAPDGKEIYKATNSGFHSLEAAVEYALTNANLNQNPENCVFEISNDTTGVSHRYRINAHGNLKLIV